MRVLKRGVWETPETWRCAVRCTRCQSTLEVSATDLEYHPFRYTGDPREPVESHYVVCTCEVCRLTFRLTAPDAVLDHLRKAAGHS